MRPLSTDGAIWIYVFQCCQSTCAYQKEEPVCRDDKSRQVLTIEYRAYRNGLESPMAIQLKSSSFPSLHISVVQPAAVAMLPASSEQLKRVHFASLC